jgi:nucleoid DNA-binding protein
MNTLELVNKVAKENSITLGRAEMIISIVMEKILDKIKDEKFVDVPDFGNFELLKKSTSPSIGVTKESIFISKNYVNFKPDKSFLEKINT